MEGGWLFMREMRYKTKNQNGYSMKWKKGETKNLGGPLLSWIEKKINSMAKSSWYEQRDVK
jgi:hypothetical protein